MEAAERAEAVRAEATEEEEECLEFEEGYDEAARRVIRGVIRWEDLEKALGEGGCVLLEDGRRLCFDPIRFCWFYR